MWRNTLRVHKIDMKFLKNSKKYPNISKLINNGGQLDIGYIEELDSYIVASNKRDILWEGLESYESLEDALDDAEKCLKDLI
jgi:hypothetical protein